MIYLELLWAFIQIGVCSFGGGYASLPLIQSIIVENHGWISSTEFVDITAISQMTPGPVGINAATFVGLRIGGVGGAIVATFGVVLPSCVIILTLAALYKKYSSLRGVQTVLGKVRPAAVSLIAGYGIPLMLTVLFGVSIFDWSLFHIEWLHLALFCAAFVILRTVKKIGTLPLMAGGAVIGAIWAVIG